MAENDVKKAALLRSVQETGRVSVRRVKANTGLSESTVYRYVTSIQAVYPIRIERGVIFYDER